MDNTTQSPYAETSSTSKRPWKTIGDGDCSVSIWRRNVNKNGIDRTMHSITFERRYKDKDGKFQYAKTFDVDSLPQLLSLIQKTWDELRRADVTQ